jgi:hypothetical protein
MPRRPLPASREKSGGGNFAANVASGSKVQLPLPKATSKQKLKAADSEPGLDGEGWGSEDSSSDSDEEDSEEGEGDSGDGSLEDSDEVEEESDVDLDAPRVAQWVDDEDLDDLEMPSEDGSPGKAANAKDIVRVVLIFLKVGWLIIYLVLHRKPYKMVGQSTTLARGLSLITQPCRLGFATARCPPARTTSSC